MLSCLEQLLKSIILQNLNVREENMD